MYLEAKNYIYKNFTFSDCPEHHSDNETTLIIFKVPKRNNSNVNDSVNWKNKQVKSLFYGLSVPWLFAFNLFEWL